MLSQKSKRGDIEENSFSIRTDDIQINYALAFDIPLYFDSTLERKTTFCLVEDQEMKLSPKNKQNSGVLCL